MKNLNKKTGVMFAIGLLLLVLASSYAHARPFTQVLEGGLSQFHNFFAAEQYKPYSKAIDFFFFAILFTAIYMMGARYAFREMKKPERVIVILLGLMTAFLLVLGGFSATLLLPYLHWLLYLLLFILFWWLLKGIKSPFWRFLLALLLALLTIALLQGLFDALSPPDLSGGDSALKNFFKSIGESFKGIDIGVQGIGLPDYAKDFLGIPQVTTPTGPEIVAPTPTPADQTGKEDKGFWGNNSWWIISLIFLLLLGGIGAFGIRAWRKRKPKSKEDKKKQEEELTLEKIKDEIKKIIELKQKILKSLRDIMERKKKLAAEELEVYHKITGHPSFDPAYLLDAESEQYKEFLQASRTVTELLKLEVETEEDLIKLRIIEEILAGTNLKLETRDDLIKKVFDELKQHYSIKDLQKGKLVEWSEFLANRYVTRIKNAPDEKSGEITANDPKRIRGFYKPIDLASFRLGEEVFRAAPEWYLKAVGAMSASFKQLKNENKGLVYEIMSKIAEFLLLGRRQEDVEKELNQILDANKLISWYKHGRLAKWSEIGKRNHQALKQFFANEEVIFYSGEKSQNINEDAARKFTGPGILFKINQQMRLLQYILKLIEFIESERKSFTQLQELKVSIRNPQNQEEWTEVAAMEMEIENRTYKHYVLGNNPSMRIWTNFAEGIPPFQVICFVDNVEKAGITAQEKYNESPVVRFFNKGDGSAGDIGVLSIGRHIIRVSAISPKDTFRRYDSQTIVVDIGGRISPQPVAPTQSMESEELNLKDSQAQDRIEDFPPRDTTQGIRITSPAQNSEVFIGEYIPYLEAKLSDEAYGKVDNLIREGYRIVVWWRLFGQSTQKSKNSQTIHFEEIPIKFGRDEDTWGTPSYKVKKFFIPKTKGTLRVEINATKINQRPSSRTEVIFNAEIEVMISEPNENQKNQQKTNVRTVETAQLPAPIQKDASFSPQITEPVDYVPEPAPQVHGGPPPTETAAPSEAQIKITKPASGSTFSQNDVVEFVAEIYNVPDTTNFYWVVRVVGVPEVTLLGVSTVSGIQNFKRINLSELSPNDYEIFAGIPNFPIGGKPLISNILRIKITE